METIVRFIVGGGMIVLISFIAENRNPFLAGILAMFPIMFMTTLFIVGSSSGIDVARNLAGSMAITLPVLLAFCGTFYLSSLRLTLYPTLALSLMAWGITASIYILAANSLGK
jgi:uncharacterized membrane protein (GlpM family)